MQSPRPADRSAFTLIELCVIVALVFVLSLLLLPALAGARTNSKAVQCLNNLRRLTDAWQMYTSDNRDSLPSKLVGGVMDWTANPDNTNAAVFSNSSLSPIAPYFKGDDLFKCPADNYLSPLQRSVGFLQRVLSVASSAALGGTPGPINNQIVGRTYFAARRITELNKPGPASTLVVLDEHPDSVDDAIFHFNLGLAVANASWRNLPASYHSGAGGVSFADGSAMLKRWLDSRTTPPVTYIGLGLFNVPGSPDYVWVNDRMPYR
jgi:type II secretory pathway pseudopilin PulG